MEISIVKGKQELELLRQKFSTTPLRNGREGKDRNVDVLIKISDENIHISVQRTSPKEGGKRDGEETKI